MTFQTRTSIPEEAAKQGLLAVTIARAVVAVRQAASVVERWTRAGRSVVTPLGWGVLAASVVALVLGYGFGWLELAILGWGAVVVIALASAWLAGRGAGAIELSLPVPRVAVGESAEAHLVARNPGRRRFSGARIEVPVGRRVVSRFVPALPRGGTFDERVAIPTERRGVVPVGPARTVRADPVGLMRREIVWSEVRMLHVHPRTIAVSALSTGFLRDLEGSPTRDLTASDIAFHALREYQPGDDRRYIHWRSSAKTGTFMVRQFEETRRSRLMVLLDLAADAYEDEEDFELAVSVAASIGARAIRDARSLAFVVSGRERPRREAVTRRAPAAATPVSGGGAPRRRQPAIGELPTASRDRLLDALCLVEADDRASSLADTARAAAESISGVSLAFVVTGGARAVGDLRQAASRLPLGIETVAVRCSAEGEATARSVGGLSVYGVGYLEDLTAMLARTASVA
ncbi:DUF58 domain-containing protein [Agromyces bracchium]|uniref:DUF58 domain-containing protein n=1 Tax=Agromyces bracchium TaxID=88376 RepID=A0A6I3M604_9MICO|nr:DUF58 domain-containing protein [Agromyces bracchium]MTH68774.1 DUF58 domain-containing protein [Agromyces bracchium]